MIMSALPILYVLAGIFAFWVLLAILYRVVVPTNMVHTVQSKKKTTSYGTGREGKNVYYGWPSWIPNIGVTVIKLPVSNFDLSLNDYEAYDKDRVPFKVDVTSFFRIKDTNIASQRVESMPELKGQISLIVQGAVRKVLASDYIDEIMLERSKFGDQFTSEVSEQLSEWGVESVKSMELMDIRDTDGSRVIANIMAKKTSQIEMESRKEVAANNQAAETAEIEARQVVEIRQQQADQAVGERKALKEKAVGIALEQSKQEVLSQTKETQTRDMEVKRVELVKLAEIRRDEQVVFAEQTKKTTVIVAEGNFEAKQQEAQGIKVEGAAMAEAEKLMQLAPVQAMITLAKEIGENPGYQQYLATIEGIKAYLEVGAKQAEALQKADVKIIANSGNPVSGMKNVMDIFSTSGGTNLGGMVEAFAQTPLGELIMNQIGVKANKTDL
ncbi:MAG: hypothetical protein EOM88_03445 [Clostridia bacterium]|nr:hypothetical protein [Clostridia bacterium]